MTDTKTPISKGSHRRRIGAAVAVTIIVMTVAERLGKDNGRKLAESMLKSRDLQNQSANTSQKNTMRSASPVPKEMRQQPAPATGSDSQVAHPPESQTQFSHQEFSVAGIRVALPAKPKRVGLPNGIGPEEEELAAEAWRVRYDSGRIDITRVATPEDVTETEIFLDAVISSADAIKEDPLCSDFKVAHAEILIGAARGKIARIQCKFSDQPLGVSVLAFSNGVYGWNVTVICEEQEIESTSKSLADAIYASISIVNDGS